MLRSPGSSEFPTSKSYNSNNHRKFVALLLLKHTVEPQCATTSHKRTTIQKTKNFTSQSTGSPSSKNEHRRASALLRNIQYKDLYGKKNYRFCNLRK